MRDPHRVRRSQPEFASAGIAVSKHHAIFRKPLATLDRISLPLPPGSTSLYPMRACSTSLWAKILSLHFMGRGDIIRVLRILAA